MWQPVSTVGSQEPFYFGPLAGYGAEELDRRGLDQDKKTGKGFQWFSKKDKLSSDSNNAVPVTIENAPPGPPTKAWDGPPLTPEVDEGQGHDGRSSTKDLDEIPTWDEFTQTTTFHGVRYIFDKTPFKIRRYASFLLIQRISLLYLELTVLTCTVVETRHQKIPRCLAH